MKISLLGIQSIKCYIKVKKGLLASTIKVCESGSRTLQMERNQIGSEGMSPKQKSPFTERPNHEGWEREETEAGEGQDR